MKNKISELPEGEKKKKQQKGNVERKQAKTKA